MYKALLIDDEQPAIQALRVLGQWESHGVNTILAASDGQQGLDMLMAHKPDIVMVDMKMPRMMGTEFLEEAVRLHPAAKYVVVSGFDDFQYTKQAIKTGALDYLLKPIKRQELNSVIERAVQELQADADAKRKDIASGILYNISAPLLKEKLFADLMDNSGRYHQMEELEHLLQLDAERTTAMLGSVLILNLDDVCQKKFRGDAAAFYYAFTNGMNELCGEDAFSFKRAKGAQEIVVVLPTAVGDKEQSAVISRLRAALDKLGQLFGTVCAAAVSEGIYRLDALNAGYEDANERLEQVNLLSAQTGDQQVYTERLSSITRAHPINYTSLLVRKDSFLQALESSGFRYAEHQIEEHWQAVRATAVFPIERMRMAIIEMRMLAEGAIDRFSASREERQAMLQSFDAAFSGKLFAFTAFQQSVTEWFHTLFDRLATLGKPDDKLSPDKIKAYIDAHYAEDLSIATFTRQYFVSKEHLLRVFKGKFGFGIHEYMTKVRMEQAKRLLSDPDVRVQSIGEQVGFEDVNYFRKAFKKHVGLSPSEYREQQLQEATSME